MTTPKQVLNFFRRREADVERTSSMPAESRFLAPSPWLNPALGRAPSMLAFLRHKDVSQHIGELNGAAPNVAESQEVTYFRRLGLAPICRGYLRQNKIPYKSSLVGDSNQLQPENQHLYITGSPCSQLFFRINMRV